MKFHYRRVDGLKNKYKRLEQAQSHRSFQETNQSSRKAPARNRNSSEANNENELAEVLKAKIREVDTLLEQMSAHANNKKSESYPDVLTYPLEIREEGERNRTDNKAVKSRKRIERRKVKEKKRFLNNVKSPAGLKCRSQVTGQVTGYRAQGTGQATGQVTGHRSQVTGHRPQVTGHTQKQ